MIIVNFCNEEIFKTNEFIAGLNYISKLNKYSKNDLQKISTESFKRYKKKNSLFRTAKIIIENLNL